MENKICCEKCSEEFEDGEMIGIIDDKTYHCIFEAAEKYSGCADKMPQAGIFYKGHVYSIFDMAKLKNLKEIKTKGTKRGFKLDGNLDDLLKCEALN
jgi:hypothetical protein